MTRDEVSEALLPGDKLLIQSVSGKSVLNLIMTAVKILKGFLSGRERVVHISYDGTFNQDKEGMIMTIQEVAEFDNSDLFVKFTVTFESPPMDE